MTKDIKMVLHYGDETHTIQGHELHHNMILRAITDAYKAQGDRWGVAFFRKLSALNSLVHAEVIDAQGTERTRKRQPHGALETQSNP